MVFFIVVRTIFGHRWHHFYNWICGLDRIRRCTQTIAIGGKTKQINKVKAKSDELIYAVSALACLSRTMTQINHFLYFCLCARVCVCMCTKINKNKNSSNRQISNLNMRKHDHKKRNKIYNFVIVEMLSKQFFWPTHRWTHTHTYTRSHTLTHTHIKVHITYLSTVRMHIDTKW